MADRSEESRDASVDDPSVEAGRFSALLLLLNEHVPELEAWRLDDAFGDELDPPTFVLGEALTLVNRHLFDEDDQPIDVGGVWPRLLAVLERALELCDLLYEDGRDDDALIVDAFAASGIMCDITRNIPSLHALLPLMGPVTLETARGEIEYHMMSRGHHADDIDWSTGGLAYRPLGVSPLALVPGRPT